MSDTSVTGSTPTSTSSSGLSVPPPSSTQVIRPGSSSESVLKTEHGTTTISDSVVAKIASVAAREVNGVAELGGSVSGALSGVLGRITPGGNNPNEPRTAGVNVEVGETQAAVDLTMRTLYPASIQQVADAVRENVRDRITTMTGLEVTEVNITVTDLVFPGEEQSPQPSRVE